MSKDSIHILLRNNYQNIQAKHEKKKHVLKTTKLRGKKKQPPSIFSRRKWRNNNKEKSIHIYYFEAKDKWKLMKMVTCEEREKIEKKLAFLEKYFFLWHRL